MAIKKRTCFVCGKNYEYCPNCIGFLGLPAWMNMYHSIDCKKLFEICTQFNMKLISQEEAQKLLAEYKIPEMDKLKIDVQATLKAINAKKGLVKKHEVVQ